MTPEELKRCDEFVLTKMVGEIRRKEVAKTKVVYLGKVFYKDERGKTAGKMWALLTLYYDNNGKLLYMLQPNDRAPEMWFLMPPVVQ